MLWNQLLTVIARLWFFFVECILIVSIKPKFYNWYIFVLMLWCHWVTPQWTMYVISHLFIFMYIIPFYVLYHIMSLCFRCWCVLSERTRIKMINNWYSMISIIWGLFSPKYANRTTNSPLVRTIYDVRFLCLLLHWLFILVVSMIWVSSCNILVRYIPPLAANVLFASHA